MRLRKAHVAEAARLSSLALRAKAHWGYSPEFMAACRAELTVHVADVDAGRVVVAEREDELLGFYVLTPQIGSRCELDALFVEPDAHRGGIGMALLGAAIEQAAVAGARTLEIQADPHAEGFYLRAGARRVGTRPSGSIPGRELPLLELDVPGAVGHRAHGAVPATGRVPRG